MTRVVEEALAREGLTYRLERAGGGFAQLEISDGTEVCRVDFAYDSRIRPAEQTPTGLMLSLEELAADRCWPCSGRAEARDFIDVAALADRFGWPHLYKLAAEKDTGFDRAAFLDALYSFERLKPEQFDLDAEGYEHLHDSIRQWRHDLQRELDGDRDS